MQLKKLLLLSLLFCAATTFSQTRARLDNGKFVSDKEITVQRLNCPAGTVQFARGVRWAPENFKVLLTINDSDNVVLPPSCYVQMSCVRYKGASSVMIEDSPACGGNAVPNEYLVIDLISLEKVTLDNAQRQRFTK